VFVKHENRNFEVITTSPQKSEMSTFWPTSTENCLETLNLHRRDWFGNSGVSEGRVVIFRVTVFLLARL
jgi:hypothetical protein